MCTGGEGGGSSPSVITPLPHSNFEHPWSGNFLIFMTFPPSLPPSIEKIFFPVLIPPLQKISGSLSYSPSLENFSSLSYSPLCRKFFAPCPIPPSLNFFFLPCPNPPSETLYFRFYQHLNIFLTYSDLILSFWHSSQSISPFWEFCNNPHPCPPPEKFYWYPVQIPHLKIYQASLPTSPCN